MASIAAITHFCKIDKNNYPLKFNSGAGPYLIPGSHGGGDVKRQCAMASGGGSRRPKMSVDLVNGKKLNGVHVGGGAPPFSGERKGELWAEEGGVEKDKVLDNCLVGRFVEDKVVYGQTFIIRSYEIGPDKTATMETLMNLLQETALNHVTCSGLAGNDFGATREMSLRKLIWVVTRVHVQVQRYSCWGDVVEIETWVDAAGRNGMRRDWIIRDFHTRQVISTTTSTWVIMNKQTRTLSKIPDQVKQEITPFYLNRTAIPNHTNDPDKIDKLTDQTADRIRSGLAPRWNDMDANQHVNNVKYIGWILESVPINVLEDFNLTSMTLEYRRECRESNLLESLTSAAAAAAAGAAATDEDSRNYTHLLRMQPNKAEIVRARTQWKSKPKLN